MKRKYRQYTDEEFTEACKRVKSISGLLREIGLKPCGGNYAHAKKTIQRLNIDTSHFTGQLWNKGEMLKDWSDYSKKDTIKKHLLNEQSHCDKCKRKTWQKQSIPLELHHVDGDRTNNKKENLQLLCCNCHALTHNWRGKKNKKADMVELLDTTDLKSVSR